jgi:hypothetical protein
MKPILTYRHGYWYCRYSRGFFSCTGTGRTAEEAYRDWAEQMRQHDEADKHDSHY